MDLRFPLLYQAHHTRHPEDLPFWLELAQSNPGAVLELGCGTGRVLLPLANTGRRVIGLDHDPAMLAVLRQDLLRKCVRSVLLPPPLIFQGDLEAFHLGLSFSLILLPCNTFSLLNEEQRATALERVAAHLEPGGRFAFSIPNPNLLRRLRRRADPLVEETFPHPLDGQPVQVSSAWEREKETFTLHWHYDHSLPGGQVERLSAHLQHFLAPPERYLAQLRTAGLEPEAVYGDFDRSPLTLVSPALIAIGKK